MEARHMMLAEKILSFLRTLTPPPLPSGITVMNPYRNADVWRLCEAFYRKYYADDHPRTLVLGINPGRFGGGTTGIPFTDPVKLKIWCGIDNSLPPKTELSANFVYAVIDKAGGPDVFFRQVYISSVCPLGFTRQGRNLNYYDIGELQDAVTGFCVESLYKQLSFGLHPDKVYCLGEGKNFAFLEQLNRKYQLFRTIIPLPHPRFIMQYKRKEMHQMVLRYLDMLK
jgi:hypothetical protein